MVLKALVDDFLAQKVLALAGVRRNGSGFGHAIRKELVSRGWDVRLVHHQADAAGGIPCVRGLKALRGQAGGLILVTRPKVTERLVREAAEAGMKRIWIQQGAASRDAIEFCRSAGLGVVHGECILMHAAHDAFPHGMHRWLRGLFGLNPR